MDFDPTSLTPTDNLQELLEEAARQLPEIPENETIGFFLATLPYTGPTEDLKLFFFFVDLMEELPLPPEADLTQVEALASLAGMMRQLSTVMGPGMPLSTLLEPMSVPGPMREMVKALVLQDLNKNGGPKPPEDPTSGLGFHL